MTSDEATGPGGGVFPEDLHYTAEHEWVRLGAGRARVGITSYAQEALGDIVYVSLPAVGSEVSAGQPLGEVESTKSVSDIYAPLSGRVVARNEALDAAPEIVNADPYGEGWLVEIEPAEGSGAEGSGADGSWLDAAAYAALVEKA